ncbi:NAD(P)H-binding protein [Paracoccus aestuariivivens]|uniref:NAD(P)H-binding protein n=2 Tax=Paracoccus aestuariivivens TaxID=1820333 RepID=A0A6L6JIF6_9RHOB|nr:NAD(P)H-binding protein [Paracoccus aestuariivivens]
MGEKPLHVLLIGATGVVGRHVLDLALNESRFAKVIALTRRPLPEHPKLINLVVDLNDLPAEADWFFVDGVISTLGTTQRVAGSAEAFRAIDHGLNLAIAKRAHDSGATHFALTSSLGADPSSRSFYLRTKGEIENDLEKIGYSSLTFVRPGLLGGTRSERRLSEDLGKVVLGVFGPILPTRWRISRPERVARALVDAIASGKPGRHIVDSSSLA